MLSLLGEDTASCEIISFHGLDCPLSSLEAMAGGNITLQIAHGDSNMVAVVSVSLRGDNVETRE